MYELDGHARHFFSQEYTKSLLHEAGLSLVALEQGEDKLYDRHSAFIKAIARKD